jgi:hypothetical protein
LSKVDCNFATTNYMLHKISHNDEKFRVEKIT